MPQSPETRRRARAAKAKAKAKARAEAPIQDAAHPEAPAPGAAFPDPSQYVPRSEYEALREHYYATKDRMNTQIFNLRAQSLR